MGLAVDPAEAGGGPEGGDNQVDWAAEDRVRLVDKKREWRSSDMVGGGHGEILGEVTPGQ